MNKSTAYRALSTLLHRGFAVQHPGTGHLLEVDRRRHYEWRRRRSAGPAKRQQRLAQLTGKIKDHHRASDGTYGAPRILHDLRDAGERVSRKTVAKCMRQAAIAGISPRTCHPPTTLPGPDPAPAPDLVGRKFDRGRPNVAWFSDTTSLATGEGWAYLCVVRDGHTDESSAGRWPTTYGPTWSTISRELRRNAATRTGQQG